MSKYFFVVLLFLYSFNCFSKDQSYIDSLVAKYEIKPDEYLAVVFLNYSSCVKCVFFPENIVNDVKTKLNIDIKLVALVSCDRLKEMKGFQKANNWKHGVEPNLKRKAKEKLGCENNTNICIISGSGEVIAELSDFDSYNSNLKKVIEAIMKRK